MVHPATIRNIALFSLTTPFALTVNIAFIFIWLFSGRKWRVLLSIVPVIFCWKMIPAVFGLHYFSENDWSKKSSTFKLMSWNVHAMGTFNTPNEKFYANGVMELIQQESPDILCLPEFAVNTESRKRKYPPRIIRENHYKEYHFNMDNGYGPWIHLGTAVFSKYPIVAYKAHELAPYIYMVQCDVKIQKDQIIRVCIVHLRSFGLSDVDKAYIEDVKKRNTDDLGKSRSFVWKFNQAYVERAQEADKAAAILAQSPYPVIVCGDFNDMPYSYTYKTIRNGFSDAFVDKGRGFGRTYNQIIPTLRIDHIFYNATALKLNAFKTQFSSFSDHSPLIANFEIIHKAKD